MKITSCSDNTATPRTFFCEHPCCLHLFARRWGQTLIERVVPVCCKHTGDWMAVPSGVHVGAGNCRRGQKGSKTTTTLHLGLIRRCQGQSLSNMLYISFCGYTVDYGICEHWLYCSGTDVDPKRRFCMSRLAIWRNVLLWNGKHFLNCESKFTFCMKCTVFIQASRFCPCKQSWSSKAVLLPLNSIEIVFAAVQPKEQQRALVRKPLMNFS